MQICQNGANVCSNVTCHLDLMDEGLYLKYVKSSAKAPHSIFKVPSITEITIVIGLFDLLDSSSKHALPDEL